MNENYRFQPALLSAGNDSVTVSDGGLTSTATSNKEIIGNLGASSGKFYYEAEFQQGGGSNSDAQNLVRLTHASNTAPGSNTNEGFNMILDL